MLCQTLSLPKKRKNALQTDMENQYLYSLVMSNSKGLLWLNEVLFCHHFYAATIAQFWTCLKLGFVSFLLFNSGVKCVWFEFMEIYISLLNIYLSYIIQVGFVNSLAFAKSGAFLVAGVAQVIYVSFYIFYRYRDR